MKITNFTPIGNFKFSVSFSDGSVKAGFTKISGLKSNSEVMEYREGDQEESFDKFAGLSKFDNLTLERGVCPKNSDLLDWRNKVYAYGVVNGSMPDEYKKDLLITVAHKNGTPAVKIKVFGAWPTRFDLSDLDAKGNDILIGTLELAHSGFEVEFVKS